MNQKLSHYAKPFQGEITITGSKSESNRLLILKQLFPEIQLKNLSNADDTVLLQNALSSKKNEIDIHHAGTAMRFLTAYYASTPNKAIVLTGSSRMQQRPIKILVNALEQLGANITYEAKEGFPPIRIIGKELLKHKVALNATISSQYISALLLIAATLKNGLEIELEGEITSAPYINMTLSLLHEIGIDTSFKKNKINVKPFKENFSPKILIVEADWSAASYYYSLVALSENATVTLHNLKKNSLQGDACLSEIYTNLGVHTTFHQNSIILKKITNLDIKPLTLNLVNAPDIAQTIAVTCLGIKKECILTGLHTLKIKETDRLQALKNELEKFGSKVEITNNSLHLFPSKTIRNHIKIKTYNDHRMAMAFAPLCLKTALEIENSEVVSKSYPAFWNDLKSLLK